MASPRQEAAAPAPAMTPAPTSGPEFSPQYERLVAIWLFAIIAVAMIVLAAAMWIFGLVALGFFGLIGMVLVFVFLLSYAAGW